MDRVWISCDGAGSRLGCAEPRSITKVRARAEAGGYGTLAYRLLFAKLEAERQRRQAEEDASDVPDAERWKPVVP